MGKHSKSKRHISFFSLHNLLSRRRALLALLFNALMILFLSHGWYILATIFGLMFIAELFMAVETAGAEGAMGKEQEMMMANFAHLTGNNNGGSVHSLHSLFGGESKEPEDPSDKVIAASFDGYL